MNRVPAYRTSAEFDTARATTLLPAENRFAQTWSSDKSPWMLKANVHHNAIHRVMVQAAYPQSNKQHPVCKLNPLISSLASRRKRMFGAINQQLELDTPSTDVHE